MNILGRKVVGAAVVFSLSALVAITGGCSSDSNQPKLDGGDGGPDVATDVGGDSPVDTPPIDASPGGDAPNQEVADAPSQEVGDAGKGDAPSDGPSGDVNDAGVNLDVAAPAMLTATVTNRRDTTFELLWPAPSNAGQRVTGYQVRYAKAPITAANFDDTTVTTAVAYTGTPSAPGAADGMLLKLYIETDYYFAVTGTDSSGAHVGSLMATTAATAAHFNVSLIASPAGTNQAFGVTLDGSQDVTGDGLSDLLVGTSNDNHAYLFLGTTSFAPTAPAVTFTGVNPGFGATVRQIGDIDGDGLQDIAIADRPTGLKVLIYKGRANWPTTLSDAQADYVISSDSTYAGSQFGAVMDRLGDFNGDGVNDMVITAPLYNSRLGRVLVVYGKSGFTSFTAPDTTRSLEIGPDPALQRTQIGTAVVGIGHFYPGTGTTLVVSATGLLTQPSDNAGRLYAFHGRGPGSAIDAVAADHTLVGAAMNMLIGTQLTNLGAFTGGLSSVGSSNLSDAMTVSGTTGTSFLLSGTATTGPFASKIVAYRSGTTLPGQVLFGGGFSGSDTSVSLIGDAKPDVVLAGQVGGTVDIIDGAKVGSLSSPTDTATAADVHMTLPTGWGGSTPGSHSLIRDINGDGYPDFVLGDVFGTVPGRVAVFW